MSAVIRAVPEGTFLAEFDLEAAAVPGEYPTGRAIFSPKLEDAILFADKDHALRAYLAPSVTVPRRPDGKLNRPLTAFTVEIVDVEDIGFVSAA